MKHFLFLIISFAIGPVFAGDIQIVYKDKLNGLSWSRKLPGLFSNGCLDADKKYDERKCTQIVDASWNHFVDPKDSDAAKACSDLNARLPTEEEAISLIRNFDHIDSPFGPRLTGNGLKEMYGIFTDAGYFWTSSVVTADPVRAMYLNSLRGRIENLGRYFVDGAVRCVSP